MGVCLFIATGREFAVDQYLKSSPFEPMNVLRKGEIPPADPYGHPRNESSFVVLVSHDEEKGLAQQFVAAMQLLLKHEKELDRLSKTGVETLVFNFGYPPPNQMRSEVYIPPKLLMAMARFKMGMVFTTLLIPPG
jgi:hypothetical protein